MIRLVEVFCATQRHQKTKNKKNESQTKVRMAYLTAGNLDARINPSSYQVFILILRRVLF